MRYEILDRAINYLNGVQHQNWANPTPHHNEHVVAYAKRRFKMAGGK